jgi:hypothetical protein
MSSLKDLHLSMEFQWRMLHAFCGGLATVEGLASLSIVWDEDEGNDVLCLPCCDAELYSTQSQLVVGIQSAVQQLSTVPEVRIVIHDESYIFFPSGEPPQLEQDGGARERAFEGVWRNDLML